MDLFFVFAVVSSLHVSLVDAVIPVKPATVHVNGVIQYSEGTTMELTCSHASCIAITKYKWYKDGATISDGGTISGAATSTLKVKDMKTTDSGQYKCRTGTQDGFGPDTTTPVSINVGVGVVTTTTTLATTTSSGDRVTNLPIAGVMALIAFVRMVMG